MTATVISLAAYRAARTQRPQPIPPEAVALAALAWWWAAATWLVASRITSQR